MTLEMIIADLPQLTGSEKQVAWAEKIRKEQIGNYMSIAKQVYDSFNGGMIEKHDDEKALDILRRAKVEIEKAVAKLTSESGASKWIDNRFCNTQTIAMNEMTAIVDCVNKEAEESGIM
jgi:hypothetical protein